MEVIYDVMLFTVRNFLEYLYTARVLLTVT